MSDQSEHSTEELVSLLSPNLGVERASLLVKDAIGALGLSAVMSDDEALAVLERLAGEPGLVGVTARFAKGKLLLPASGDTRKQGELVASITHALGGTINLRAALEIMLEQIGQHTRWAFGAAWIPRRAGGVLECVAQWCDPAFAPRIGVFRTTTSEITFVPGVGLPGRVWVSKQAAWIRDVRIDSNFPRFRAAEAAGICSAMGIPVLSGVKVVAVVEYFLTVERREDKNMLALASAVAAQLGALVERIQQEQTA